VAGQQRKACSANTNRRASVNSYSDLRGEGKRLWETTDARTYPVAQIAPVRKQLDLLQNKPSQASPRSGDGLAVTIKAANLALLAGISSNAKLPDTAIDRFIENRVSTAKPRKEEQVRKYYSFNSGQFYTLIGNRSVASITAGVA
jgi:hypothetical protein